MKKIFLLGIAVFLCCSAHAAESGVPVLKTFSNDIFTFQYDPSVPIDLVQWRRDAWRLSFGCSGTEADSCRVSISYFIPVDFQEEINSFESEYETEYYFFRPTGECEKEIIGTPKDDRHQTIRQKIIGIYDDSEIVYASFFGDSPSQPYYDCCETVYNSVKVTEAFAESGIPASYLNLDLMYFSETFLSPVYSQQMRIFAEKAYKLCTDFINMDITYEEARESFEELERRAKAYSEITDNRFDNGIYYDILSSPYKFRKDADFKEIFALRDKFFEASQDPSASAENASGGSAYDVIEGFTVYQDSFRSLMEEYYKAFDEADIVTIRRIVSDLSPEDVASIQDDQSMVESRTVKGVYVKPGMADGSYVIYSTIHVKYRGYAASIPVLSVVYVFTDVDGSLKVDGAASSKSEILTYIRALNQGADVKKLSEAANEEMERVLSDPLNEDLVAFLQSLQK